MDRARQRDAAGMMLIAGFVLAGAAILAIGTFTALNQGQVQVVEEQRSEMADLFLNTRGRAVEFFETVDAGDANSSVAPRLESYMLTQHRTAHTLALELNATLLAEDTIAPVNEEDDFLMVDPGTGELVYNVCATDGSECYTTVEYDDNNDGLITQNDRVLAGLFWLRVKGPNGYLEEVLVIDVPVTTPS